MFKKKKNQKDPLDPLEFGAVVAGSRRVMLQCPGRWAFSRNEILCWVGVVAVRTGVLSVALREGAVWLWPTPWNLDLVLSVHRTREFSYIMCGAGFSSLAMVWFVPPCRHVADSMAAWRAWVYTGLSPDMAKLWSLGPGACKVLWDSHRFTICALHIT